MTPETSFSVDRALAVPLSFLSPSYRGGVSVATFVHLFYEETASEILAYVNNLPFGTDLYISTDTAFKRDRIARFFEVYRYGACEVRVVPNRGRDIAPKLIAFREAYDTHEFVLHLHSKRSVHDARLNSWRTYLYETLCGSREQVQDILGVFQQFPNMGMIFPQHYEYIRRWLNWGNNFSGARALATRFGYEMQDGHPLDFPSGSMFWARSAALRPLLDLDLSFDDFQPEHGQSDDTLAHVIERLYAIVCEHSGHDWLKVARPELLMDASQVFSPRDSMALKNFLAAELKHLIAGKPVPDAADPDSTTIPIAPVLESIAGNHAKLTYFAEKFGYWTQRPAFPWCPPVSK